MSNRKTLIDALHRLSAATLPELVDATGWPERKVRDTIGDCRSNGLVSSARDDVTGKPLYRLTKYGAAWQPPKSGRPLMNGAASTPAGGGEISPAAPDRATSLATSFSGEAGTVAPPKPDSSPAAAGADESEETVKESLKVRFTTAPADQPYPYFATFDTSTEKPVQIGREFTVDRDDDTDPHAFPRSRRIVCSASSDGQFTIHRPGTTGITLTAAEARTVFEFLEDAQPIFERIAP